MNWLLALLAFAGIMTILSTIVSVAVETVHKVFAMRRSGLEEMLRALHENVIAQIDPEANEGASASERTREARSFARAMMANPSTAPRWNWASNLPILRIFFQSRFENLTKLQFVEQLAQTRVGQALAHLDRDAIRGALSRATYEFDRFGDAQRAYFGRRAKMLSGLTALIFVIAANINAVEIYRYLASNEDAVRQALLMVDDNEVDEFNRWMNRRLAEVNAGSPDADAVEELGTRLAEFQDDLAAVASSGLPIGQAYFPFCAPVPGTAEEDIAASPSCVKYASADQVALKGLASFTLGGGESATTFETLWLPRLFTLEGFVWVLSMIATAGLLGLGAPFWFNLFRDLSALASTIRPGVGAPPPSERAAPSPSGEEPHIDSLVSALLVRTGVDPGAGLNVPGRGASAPSGGSGRGTGAPPAASAEGDVPMRHLRG